MDSETLTYLLYGGHINMPDREARGLWPHPPLRLEHVLDHIEGIVEQNEWFPRQWYPHQVGEPVDERATIQQAALGRFIYRVSRAHPTRPGVVAQTVEHVFPTARDAARYFLKWDLHLPGNLDGWTVIE
jgi:hypothetical protein